MVVGSRNGRGQTKSRYVRPRPIVIIIFQKWIVLSYSSTGVCQRYVNLVDVSIFRVFCHCSAKMSQFNLASKVAFGAARCAIGVKDHEVSLMRAFRKGIRGTYASCYCFCYITVAYRRDVLLNVGNRFHAFHGRALVWCYQVRMMEPSRSKCEVLLLSISGSVFISCWLTCCGMFVLFLLESKTADHLSVRYPSPTPFHCTSTLVTDRLPLLNM